MLSELGRDEREREMRDGRLDRVLNEVRCVRLDLKSRFDNFDGGKGKLLVALVIPSRCAPKTSFLRVPGLWVFPLIKKH